jgi:hypothetical protein
VTKDPKISPANANSGKRNATITERLRGPATVGLPHEGCVSRT